MKTKSFLMVWLCMLITSTVVAQVKTGDKGELSGLVFGDYFWISSNHNSNLEGQNGFWIRRIYLTYDREISNFFSSRLRLEMSSVGDFLTNSKMIPVVKDAYLKWKNDTQQVLVGISSVPALGLAEDTWGYRSVEKSPLDLHKFTSSRDFGITAKGQLNQDGSLKYHVMFGNGNGNKNEVNKGKKIMLAFSWQFSEHLTIQGYGDWNDNTENRDTYTAQGIIAYRSDELNVGILYAHQLRENTSLVAGEDINIDLASLFANFELSDKVTGLLRADRTFDPNPGMADNDYIPFYDQSESTFLVGGVDIALDPKVHLIPNIEAIVYDKPAEGQTQTSDVIPRLTLFYTF